MPSSRQRRSLALLAAGAALTAGVTSGLHAAAAPASGAKDPNSDATVSTGLDSTSAVVGLSRAPLATDPALSTSPGHKRDFNNSAAKSERAKIVAQRNAFKKWLHSNAPKAQVTGEYDVAVNAVAVRLNGTALSALAKGPGVTSVGYQGTYRPTADPRTNGGQDPDLSLIRATSPADATAGKGIEIGVIDSGIDVNHPCFSDEDAALFPPTSQQGNPAYTNNKVIVAKVFANKAAKYGYDAEAVGEHGTHVAGTIACDAKTPATIDHAKIPYDPSGVAPGARLGSYNVFPGDIENARSEDILNALDAAAADGMDVINMSLGGNAHGVQDLLTTAVDNLDRAGIVVAVSAGNDGPGHYTVGSPGSAERALTAGASSVGHYLGQPITGASGKPTYSIANGDGDFPVIADVTAPLAQTVPTAADAVDPNDGLGLGCSAASFAGTDFTGTIALISRGDCSFATKVDNAATAKAVAVIIVNSKPGDPIAMAGDPTLQTLPAVMAPQADLQTLTDLANQQVKINKQKEYAYSGNDNIMGDFSSQGPTDVDFRVKPDLVAPGVSVLSSIPLSFCDKDAGNSEGCWAFFNGTSMASPHLAGTAAVVRSAHPGWTAEQVRSAITNTAQRGALFNYETITDEEKDPLVTGAGLADVQAALGARVALSSVSTSFGAVPSGSGKTLSRTIAVTSLTGAAQTLSWTITGDSAFGPASGTVQVPATGAATLTVSYNPAKGIAKGDHSATLDLGVAHSVLYAFAK